MSTHSSTGPKLGDKIRYKLLYMMGRMPEDVEWSIGEVVERNGLLKVKHTGSAIPLYLDLDRVMAGQMQDSVCGTTAGELLPSAA